MRRKKLDDIILDVYRELYANCTTPCNFDDLVKNASIDENGRKIIPYDEYEIDDTLMRNIIESHMIKHKLKKWEKDNVRFNVLLGVAPKSINWNETCNKDKKINA